MSTFETVGRTGRLTILLAGTALAALATAAAPNPAHADDEPSVAPAPQATLRERVVPLVQPSIVYEEITWTGYVWDRYNKEYLRDDAFQVTFQCSGFVVNPDGWLATAGHCVDVAEGKAAVMEAAAEWALENDWYDEEDLVPDDIISQLVVDTEDKNNAVLREIEVHWGTAVSGIKSMQAVPARVMGIQTFEAGDAALLKVNETGLNAIQVAAGPEPEINSEVISVGYPGAVEGATAHDLVPTFMAGTVSSTKTQADGLWNLLQLDSGMTHGMSGGPTLDVAANVVGINSSGFDGESIKYAVPVGNLLELMADKGVPPAVSETTQDYRAGITAYFEGDKATALELLTSVTQAQPANELATEYLSKAKALPDPPAPPQTSTTKKGESRSLLYVLAGGGAAVLVAALQVLTSVRRRRSGGRQRALRLPKPSPAPAAAPDTTSNRPSWVPLTGEPAATESGPHPPHQEHATVPEPARLGFLAPDFPASTRTPTTTVASSVGTTMVPPSALFCHHCGHALPMASAFCLSCGMPTAQG